MLLKLVILIVLAFLTCDCANILGIVPTPSFSHQIAYANLWKELSLKGHNVTVLTANPQNDSKLTNLTEIDLSIGYDILEKDYNWSSITPKLNPIKFAQFVQKLGGVLTDTYLSLPDVRKIRNGNHHFDVVMVEYFFPEFLMFGEFFHAPTIMLASLDVLNRVHAVFQNPNHPIVYPEVFLPFTGELSFTERLAAILFVPFFNYIRLQHLPQRQDVIQKHFGDICLPLDALPKKASMLFIAADPVLLYPRPLSPRTIIIGGASVIKEPKELNQDIQDFLDSAKNGAIYFSLGSNAKSENLGEETVIGIIQMLSDLPYSVLWKLDNSTQYRLPKNIMTANWLSQQDVLRHPNVKLFITQGGMQSVAEAIHFEKPLVGIPVFADQINNVRKLESKGVMKVVSLHHSLDPVVLKEAILEVIQNKSYSENMKKLKILNLDQPTSGLEKGVWWTEYVIRHKGNMDHMIHSPANTIPFYQYYLLDVFGFVLVVLFFVLGLLYLLLACLLRKIFRSRNSDNKEKIN